MSTLKILRDPSLLELGIANRRRFSGNQIILNEGSFGQRLYLVENGSVRVSGRVELEGGRYIQPGLCDLEPGDIFGELSLFADQPRCASVLAIEDCELLEFDGPALSTYLRRHPELGFAVLQSLFEILGARLRQMDKRWEQLFAWGLKKHGIEHLL